MTPQQAETLAKIVRELGHQDAGVFLSLDVRNMADGSDGLIVTTETLVVDDYKEQTLVTIIDRLGDIADNYEEN